MVKSLVKQDIQSKRMRRLWIISNTKIPGIGTGAESKFHGKPPLLLILIRMKHSFYNGTCEFNIKRFTPVRINNFFIPIAHAVNPASKDGMKIFDMARELKITVMVHTGSGAPFSDPMMILPAAKQFPDVKIVIAHAGTDLLKSEAVFLTKTYDQIYIEPSWLGISATKAVIESCGVNKVMFSSDHPRNVPMELLKYRNLISDSEDLERVLSGTVIEAFELKTK